MDKIIYTCVACGVKAVVIDGKIIRPCTHQTAGVTADLKATAYGLSSLAGK